MSSRLDRAMASHPRRAAWTIAGVAALAVGWSTYFADVMGQAGITIPGWAYGERHNLVDESTHHTKQEELARRVDDFFDRYADPQYDLKHGGRSKAARRVK